MYSYGPGGQYWDVHKKHDFNPYDETIDRRQVLDEDLVEQMNNPDVNYYIYFEKQQANTQCGLHTINNLLQGPYYDRDGMVEVAEYLRKEDEDINKTGAISLEVI